MRVPLEWLHEFCAPDLDVDALADRLDMTGTKVERVLRHGVDALEHFVVGEVLSAERHPDADRLTVCLVDVGDEKPANIVCGAPNVAAGQTVAVARPGAVMPDGTKLGRAKLRGIVSEGMILAEDELAIGTEHAGTMVLDPPSGGQAAPGGDGAAFAPGAPLAAVLPIATDVLELEITPNRPDCLGVYGVAREVHAATGAPLGPAPWTHDPGTDGDAPPPAGGVAGVAVEVADAELCPRFTARAFENVRLGPSPPWLKARLMAAGQRPISNVVDITNYVMLLTGQPLHAFDLDRVAGGRLVVRRAGDGERVQTLDGEERELDSDVVIICDDDGPTSIAGVMGGARSEVSETTTRVLMEAATWNGPNIQRTSTRLTLRSEASARFEKQLQPEQALEAQAVAAVLMVELCDATLVPGTIDVGGPGPALPTIALRIDRVAGLLGAEIPVARCAEILRALGFGVSDGAGGLEVSVPHHRRADVTREVDLVEEVARIDGMERLPATLPARREARGGLTDVQQIARRAEDALTDRGLHEAVGWSLAGPAVLDRLRLPEEDPRRREVSLENPMSEDQSRMRTLLLGSLLDVARQNVARGASAVRIFESGAVYLAQTADGLPDERRHLGALLTGPARPESWRGGAGGPADFFAAKGVLAALLDTLRVSWSVEPASEPFLHPGRSAAVLVDDEPVGWVGELHPLVARAWDLEAAAVFEVHLGAIAERAAAAHPVYEDVTSFPAVRQDLAVVVAQDTAAERVRAVIRAAGGKTLARADVFDVYRGDQVGEGRVSLALALEFRTVDRTLTDEEVAGHRERIAAALRDELGGELRG